MSSDSILTVEAFLIALLGLVVGSFINTVIYRVPRSLSIITPGSRCPHCDQPIRFYDNIPLLSFLVLGGRCRRCRTRISLRYPLVEVLTAGLFLAAWTKFGPGWRLISVFGFVGTLIALSFIDLEHRMLPDVITLPSFVVSFLAAGLGWSGEALQAQAVGSTLAVFLTTALIAASGPVLWLIDWVDLLLVGKKLDGDPEQSTDPMQQQNPMRTAAILSILSALVYLAWARFMPAVFSSDPRGDLARVEAAYLGAAVGGGSLWLIRLFYGLVRGMEGTGFGDVKMMLFVGAFLGWPLGLATIFIGAMLAAPPASITLLRSRNRLSTIPFGIFLGGGALISLFFGDRLLHWYLTTWFY